MGLLNEFYIQLYSVREELAKDFPGVLRKLGKMGYTGVEFAGYGGYSATELKKLLDECGRANRSAWNAISWNRKNLRSTRLSALRTALIILWGCNKGGKIYEVKRTDRTAV